MSFSDDDDFDMLGEVAARLQAPPCCPAPCRMAGPSLNARGWTGAAGEAATLQPVRTYSDCLSYWADQAECGIFPDEDLDPALMNGSCMPGCDDDDPRYRAYYSPPCPGRQMFQGAGGSASSREARSRSPRNVEITPEGGAPESLQGRIRRALAEINGRGVVYLWPPRELSLKNPRRPAGSAFAFGRAAYEVVFGLELEFDEAVLLSHAKDAISSLLALHGGAINFKVGLTRDPESRMRQYEARGMLVLCKVTGSCAISRLETEVISAFSRSPFCRNVAPGGESAGDDESRTFYLYVVFGGGL